jgi:ACS family hexuronate transporter-like MFS transporter
MFASTVLNYMDRQTISLLREPISREYHLDDAGFGWVMSAFLLSYAFCQLPAGFLVDRWDVRRTYAGAVAWWSAAGVAAAFSPTLGVLLALRALLGVGESFNWPCALKVTGLVLPPSERSLGNGIFNSGAAVGAVVTPLIVTPMTLAFGWRMTFVVVGSLGFVWVAVWLLALGGERRTWLASHDRPKASPADEIEAPPSRLGPLARLVFGAVAGSALVGACSAYWFGAASVWWAIAWLMFGLLFAARLLPLKELQGADWAERLGAVVRYRRFWVLVLVSVSINVCWHFLVNWLPSYLKSDRGMSFLAGGLWSAVPFLAADVGNLGGGALSRLVAARGVTPTRARLAVMSVCTLLITCGAWVGWVESDTVVLVLLGVMAMATAAFMANYFAFAQEVSPRHTGLIVGILGGLGNLCAAGFLPVAGMVKVATGGFGPVFVLVGLLPFVGLGALWLAWGAEPQSGAEPA